LLTVCVAHDLNLRTDQHNTFDFFTEICSVICK